MRSFAPHVLVVASALAATAAPAWAHVLLDDPARRYDEMKAGPCGRGGSADGRTDRVSAFDPGDTITVTWTETIDHTGSFRIAFDEDGDDEDDFATTILYEAEDPANEDNKQWSTDVTLPDVECGNCTLQLIQVMTTGEPQDGDLYFQCADLVVGDVPSAPPEITTGGCAGCASTPGEALAGALALALVRRTQPARRRCPWSGRPRSRPR